MTNNTPASTNLHRIDVMIVRLRSDGRPGARWSAYTTLDHAAATRVATMLGALKSSWDRVEVQRSAAATLVHTEGSGPQWALWSDGVVTGYTEHCATLHASASVDTTHDLPRLPEVSGLSPDARELINMAVGSDSPCPECGWATLARVSRIVSRSEVVHTSGATIERLDCETAAGELVLYTRVEGADDGYSCEVSEDLAKLTEQEDA